jgi:uncharacterized protein with HEPN domain
VSPKPAPPARPWRQRVQDMIDAIDETASFVAGMSFEQFRSDAKTQKAVLANFAIIGEAVAHVPPDVQAAAPDIPWAKARARRNIIVHVYFGVELSIVWDTVGKDLPALREQLAALLAEPA